MRRTLRRLHFAAWAVFIVAIYVFTNPRAMWRMVTARHDQRDAGPETGLSGAGVLAPLVPPPPIIVASISMELPRSDVNET
jgi:hypothetical protein